MPGGARRPLGADRRGRRGHARAPAGAARGCDARVSTARSVAEAAAFTSNDPPDLIVSGVRVPDDEGALVGESPIAELRALGLQQGGRPPIVALTPDGRAGTEQGMRDAGYALHVRKPIDPDRLLQALGKVARERR